MMPSSAAMFSQLAVPPADEELRPPKMAKKTKTPRVPMRAPVSGR